MTFLVENELDDCSNPQSERDTLDVHCNFCWPGRRNGKLASNVTNTIYIEGERRFLILAEKNADVELHWLGHQSPYHHWTCTVFLLTHETTWLLLPHHSSFDVSPLALLPTCWRSLFIASTPGDYGKGSELPHGRSDGSPLRRRRYPSSCLFFLRPLLLGYSTHMLAELLYCVHARRLWKGEQVASQLLRRSSLRRRRYP